MNHQNLLTEGIDWVARFCDIPENDTILQAILQDFCERMGFAQVSLITFNSPAAFDYRTKGYVYFSSSGRDSCPGRVSGSEEEVQCQCMQILCSSPDLKPKTWIDSEPESHWEDFPCLAVRSKSFFRITHLPVFEGKKVFGVLHLFENSENPVSGIAHDVLYSLVPLLGKQLRRRLDILKHRKEREFLMAALNYSPDPSILVNPEREILVANPAMRNVFGYEAAEMIGKKTAFLYENEEEYERLGVERFNLSATEREKPYTVNYRRKDGSLFPGETVGTVVHNRRGEVIGYQALIREISDRIASETSLQQRKTLFRSVFDTVPCAVFISGKGKVISKVNRAATKIYGKTAEQMIGGEFTSFRASREEYLAQVGANSKTDYLPSQGETLVFQRRGDGSIFPAIIAGGPIYNEETELQGYITIVEDISVRIGIESRLKQSNQRLQSMVTSRTTEVDTLHSQYAALRDQLRSLIDKISSDVQTIRELVKDAASLPLSPDTKMLVHAMTRALEELQAKLPVLAPTQPGQN